MQALHWAAYMGYSSGCAEAKIEGKQRTDKNIQDVINFCELKAKDYLKELEKQK